MIAQLIRASGKRRNTWPACLMHHLVFDAETDVGKVEDNSVKSIWKMLCTLPVLGTLHERTHNCGCKLLVQLTNSQAIMLAVKQEAYSTSGKVCSIKFNLHNNGLLADQTFPPKHISCTSHLQGLDNLGCIYSKVHGCITSLKLFNNFADRIQAFLKATSHEAAKQPFTHA